MKNKIFLLITFCFTLFNSSTTLASDEQAKHIKPLSRPINYTINIEITTEKKSGSLESYIRVLNRLNEVASSRRNSKKVFLNQWGYTISLRVKLHRLYKKQAQMEAKNLITKINEEMTFPEVKMVKMTRKRL